MRTTHGRLTVEQAASRVAVTADCHSCGESAVMLAARPGATIDHRCGGRSVGPVWTLTERPPATAARSAEVFGAGGVITSEQLAALGGPAMALVHPGERFLTRDQVTGGEAA